MAQIRAIAFELKPEVICITESWMHPVIPDAFLRIDECGVYRQDRTSERGGGSLLYIKGIFKHFTFDLNAASFSDNYCFASIILSPRQKMILGCIYNPPIIP
ncbi:unnamed protein product [Dibothriocephalus latus]|uniref:Endonuclease/exonuclease/phosphatase domain-containing protein n=1 Tax=Dibothriocephalus latus TaxID=60516 RepID=A0A3P7LFM3_DIBLA|nr:unnamed protein product [Dibothriocephalus latus]